MSQEADQESAKQLTSHVLQKLQSGQSRESVAAELSATGLEPATAAEIVEKLDLARQRLKDGERITPPKLLIAAIGAGWAALVCGIIWGAIVILTDHEIGFVAWGVGLVCGAVVAFATKARGIPLQVIAVVASLAGVFVGKYVILAHLIKQQIADQQGAAAAAEISYFSVGMLQLFAENVQLMLTPYDLLWCGLAMFTAWKIPAKTLPG